MDPRRLLTFRAVAHERSFSAAARALALTQPAVSQQVAALEKEVGARLLDREPGGLKLTRRGHGSCSSTRTRSPTGSQLARTQLAELAGDERLRVGAFPSALAALVPKAVARVAASPRCSSRRAARPSSPSACGAASCTSRSASRTPRSRAASTSGTVRHDLAREPFLVALWPGHPLAELRRRADRGARRRAVGRAERATA